MKYDFDTIIPRRGTNSYKWDTPEEENVLPMWVADMDFRTAPTIVEALQKRIAHGIFGYTKVPKAYYDAVVRWFDDRHRWQIDPRWIIYTNGVVPALSAIIKALAAPSDKIIVQTPAYNCFYSSIRNNGCELSANYLVYRDGRYTIDFDDLETKTADPKAKSCCCAILTIQSDGSGRRRNCGASVTSACITGCSLWQTRFIVSWSMKGMTTRLSPPCPNVSAKTP